jgi:hypothetical protein
MLRCQPPNASPGDCDVYHSLAGVGQLGEARWGHVDDARVTGLLAIIDDTRRARSGGRVRHGHHRPEGQRRAGTPSRRGFRVPRGLTALAVRPAPVTRWGRRCARRRAPSSREPKSWGTGATVVVVVGGGAVVVVVVGAVTVGRRRGAGGGGGGVAHQLLMEDHAVQRRAMVSAWRASRDFHRARHA